MAVMTARNLLAGLKGEILPYCANPKVYEETGKEIRGVENLTIRIKKSWGMKEETSRRNLNKEPGSIIMKEKLGENRLRKSRVVFFAILSVNQALLYDLDPESIRSKILDIVLPLSCQRCSIARRWWQEVTPDPQ